MSIRSWLAVTSTALLLSVAVQGVRPAERIAQPASSPVSSSESALPVALQYRYSADVGAANPAFHFTINDGVPVASSAALSAEALPSGVVYRNGDSAWSVSAAALNENALPVSTASSIQANRVDRPLGPVEETVIAGPLGIQQLWTVNERPQTGSALTLRLATNGPVELTGATDAVLVNESGARLAYGGLFAYDAVGTQLAAQFEQTHGGLLVRVDDSLAQYPVVIDPFAQVQRITYGSTIEPFQNLGSSVAVSDDGNTIAIGALGINFGSGLQPAVLVYTKAGTTWNLSARLRSNLGGGTGTVVSMSGDGSTIVSSAGGFGAPVSVHTRPVGGWSGDSLQTARLDAATPSFGFGASLAVSNDGTTVANGDPNGLGDGGPFGAVFVYQRPGASWAPYTNTHDSRLFAASPIGLQLFGTSVSISNDGATIAAGAPNDLSFSIGAVYIFTKPGGPWAGDQLSQAKLTHDLVDTLGMSVDFSADAKTLAVGGCKNNTTCPFASVFIAATSWTTTTTPSATLLTSNAFGAGRTIGISGDAKTVLLAGRDLATINEFVQPAGGWTGFVPVSSIINNGESMNFGTGRVPLAYSAGGEVMVLGLPSADIGTGAAFVWVQPRVTSFSPTSGKPGDVITFTGTNLNAVSTVAFGSTSANAVGPKSSTTFTATVGAGTTGSVTLGVGTSSISVPGFTFIQGSTTTSIVSTAPVASVPGQPVTVNFNVAANGVTANGVVSVTASTGEICTASPSVGSCTLTFFSPGYRSLTATYGGTTAFAAGTSAPVDYVVKLATATNITAISELNPRTNVPIDVSFTVQSSIGTPSGTVTITANTGETCTVDVSIGKCVITFTTAGPHTLRASYAGNSAYLGSASPNFDVTTGTYIYRTYSGLALVNANPF